MTLATLQAQHPDWCFTCGKKSLNPQDWKHSCPIHPVIAALKEELAKVEAYAEVDAAAVLAIRAQNADLRAALPKAEARITYLSETVSELRAELEALRAERGKEKL